jgi:hypothetical protein
MILLFPYRSLQVMWRLNSLAICIIFQLQARSTQKKEKQVARMRVPKMVKNGFNSALQTIAGSTRLVAARNSGTNAGSKTVSKS